MSVPLRGGFGLSQSGTVFARRIRSVPEGFGLSWNESVYPTERGIGVAQTFLSVSRGFLFNSLLRAVLILERMLQDFGEVRP